MVRALLLGLIVAMGSSVQQLPPGAAQVTTPQAPVESAVDIQRNQDLLSIAMESTKSPFRTTFSTPWSHQDLAAAATPAEPVPAQPSLVCGLTMIPVDPKLDPKIRHSVQSGSGQSSNPAVRHDFKIRRIAPTMCRAAKE